MKILHTESSLGWGGQEIRVLTEARALAQRGHEVILASPTSAGIYKAAPKYDLPTRAVAMEKKRIPGLLAARALLKSEHFDVINTHSSTDAWLFALACATLGSKAPPIVRTRHISSNIPSNLGSRWLYAKSTAHIATTGEALRLQVIEQTGADPARVTNVPTGIDLQRYCRRDQAQARQATGIAQAIAPDAFIVGIVATLRGWKGHRYLLEAFAKIDDPTMSVVIVGDGPQRDNLGALVIELGIQDRVIFPGNRDDVEQWLACFDVFVLPSYANEGVPQALMQAMAAGLPVITTPVGAIGEIVTDGEQGLMIKPQDSDTLRAAILRMRQDAALRERLANASWSRAQERFGVDVMADKMEAIFKKVVG
jgi:glycosyltransferase involved in cell wall biosynthesis